MKEVRREEKERKDRIRWSSRIEKTSTWEENAKKRWRNEDDMKRSWRRHEEE